MRRPHRKTLAGLEGRDVEVWLNPMNGQGVCLSVPSSDLGRGKHLPNYRAFGRGILAKRQSGIAAMATTVYIVNAFI